MTNESTFTALLVEPNEKLTHPYNLLPSHYHITRVSSIVEAQNFVTKSIPSHIFLSASFSVKESVDFLESVQKQLYSSIPKLIFVVDFSNPQNTIPGISWASAADVISSQTPEKVIAAMLV